MSRPVLIFVHGAFCGGWAFERFVAPFKAAGYDCRTPDLPGHAKRASRSSLASCGMADYARALTELAAGLPAPPVLIGHSLGGLASMMAAARAPLAGIGLLAPCAPWGIAGASFGEAVSATAIASMGPFPTQTVDPDYFVAEQYSLNRMSMEERRATYDRMGPESGRALWETLTWWLDPFMTTQLGRVDCPAWAGVGGRDVVNPLATVRQTAEKLKAELKVYDAMSHWLIGEPGWEGVAADLLAWVEGLA